MKKTMIEEIVVSGDMIKSEQHPFFSVCIPVYNAEKYLRSCIDSVLQQDETDFEIILVNDGSIDRSGEICDEYAAVFPFITVYHKDNEGPLMARHDAVKKSKGRYLMFLDADDMFAPNLFDEIKKTIIGTGADMIVFDFKYVYPDQHFEVLTEPYFDGMVFEGKKKGQFYSDFVMNSALNSMWRKCIYRDVYDVRADYAQYNGMIQGEDKLISIFCIDRAQKIVYLKRPLYSYRVNLQGTSHNTTLKNYKDVQILHEVVLKYIDLWKLPETVRKGQMLRRLGAGYNCVISLACRIKSGKSTKKELSEAVSYIREDKRFIEAYNLTCNKLDIYKRAVCFCIMNKLIWVLRLLAVVMIRKNVQ